MSRKIFIVIIAFVIIMLLCSCDLLSRGRPAEYNDTKWFSEELDIYF